MHKIPPDTQGAMGMPKGRILLASRAHPTPIARQIQLMVASSPTVKAMASTRRASSDISQENRLM